MLMRLPVLPCRVPNLFFAAVTICILRLLREDTRMTFTCARQTFAIGLLALLSAAAPAQAQDTWKDKFKGFFGGDAATAAAALPVSEIGQGLKEALRVGATTVVDKLGRTDGFNADPNIRIPLPGALLKAQKTLSKLGMGKYGDDLQLKLNRAAETATPKAKELFLGAIRDMTLDDVMQIYEGPNDAATSYFKNKMSPGLAAEMKPVVDQSLADVGAVTSYNSFINKYRGLPLVPDVQTDVSSFVVDKAMNGIFYYMAQEEAAIRANPAKRTTEILKKVFGK